MIRRKYEVVQKMNGFLVVVEIQHRNLKGELMRREYANLDFFPGLSEASKTAALLQADLLQHEIHAEDDIEE